MSDRVRLGLELVYVALENLHIVVADDGDADGNGASLTWLLVLAADMQGAITEYWQGLDVDVIDEIELGG